MQIIFNFILNRNL